MITLLLAGEDTTAHTLAWTLHHLALHPQWQQRLHDQARAVMGDADVCPTLEQLSELDAFEACATEAIRLKPIVPLFHLETCADVVLDGVRLPAGTSLISMLRPLLHGSARAQALSHAIEQWATAALAPLALRVRDEGPEAGAGSWPMLVGHLAHVDALLADGDYLLGDAPGLADFAIFGPLSSLLDADRTRAAVRARPRLERFVQRIERLGANGAGIAVMPSFAVAADLASGGLRQLLPECRSAPFELFAVAPPASRLSARARLVMDALAAYAAKPVHRWGEPM